MNLAERLRAARAHLGLTYAQLAKRWRVPVSTLANWEKGRNAPQGLALATLKRLLTEAEAMPQGIRVERRGGDQYAKRRREDAREKSRTSPQHRGRSGSK